ncbi:MAG TPA: hypothetical protein VIQ74_05330 [Gemmatimonadaceae bacterium]|jgi:hypothetical protein
MAEKIRVWLDEEFTARVGTDEKTGELVARFYRCRSADGDLGYDCAVPVILSDRFAGLGWLTAEQRGEEVARLMAETAFRAIRSMGGVTPGLEWKKSV